MKILIVLILYFSSIVKMRKSHRHDAPIQDRMGPNDCFKDRMIQPVVFNVLLNKSIGFKNLAVEYHCENRHYKTILRREGDLS